MQLMYLPAIIGLIPALSFHVCYLISAEAGHVPWCIPYIDSCTSISAVGRDGLERFFFRATMMPTAILMMLYWTLNYQWLKNLKTNWRRANQAMLVLGIAACFGLLLYTTVLGVIGDSYQLYRRVGVTIFYTFSVTAQILLTLQIGALMRRGTMLISRAIWWALCFLCFAVLAAGTLNILLPSLTRIEVQDALAWIATFLILLHFFPIGRAWQETGFRVAFDVGATRD